MTVVPLDDLRTDCVSPRADTRDFSRIVISVDVAPDDELGVNVSVATVPSPVFASRILLGTSINVIRPVEALTPPTGRTFGVEKNEPGLIRILVSTLGSYAISSCTAVTRSPLVLMRTSAVAAAEPV